MIIPLLKNNGLWVFLVVTVMSTSVFGRMIETPDLDAYRWKKRVLFIFATSERDLRYRSFLKEMEGKKEKMVDRDLVLGHVFERGGGRFDDVALTKQACDNLRKRFSIGPGGFVVVLIGKDGGEKLRQS